MSAEGTSTTRFEINYRLLWIHVSSAFRANLSVKFLLHKRIFHENACLEHYPIECHIQDSQLVNWFDYRLCDDTPDPRDKDRGMQRQQAHEHIETPLFAQNLQ